MPLFVSLSCTSANPDRGWPGLFARHLLPRHGAPARGADRQRPLGWRRAAPEDVPEPGPRAGSDRLPLQRAGLRLLVRPDRRDHRMYTQLPASSPPGPNAEATRPRSRTSATRSATPSCMTPSQRSRPASPAAGLARGDRVGIYLDKRLETVVSFFGTSAAGGVFVPINPAAPAEAGRVHPRRLQRARARDLRRSATRCCARNLRNAPRSSTSSCSARGSPMARSPGRLPRRRHGGGGARHRRRHGRDPLHVGQHGQAEGRGLSHRNLLVGGASVSQYLGNDENDCILAALPLTSTPASPADDGLHGRRACRAHELPAAGRGREALRKAPGDRAHMRPAALDTARGPAVARRGHSQPALLRRHRRPNAAGDARTAACDLPGSDPYLMYGLTEAFRSTYLDPAEVDRRPDSIGKAIPNAEIMVVREDGTLCEPGEEGELVHRGALVALGYWGDPEQQPQSGSSRRRAARRASPRPRSPCGRAMSSSATRRASSTSSAARTR